MRTQPLSPFLVQAGVTAMYPAEKSTSAQVRDHDSRDLNDELPYLMIDEMANEVASPGEPPQELHPPCSTLAKEGPV
jgi:hypothetical protein